MAGRDDFTFSIAVLALIVAALAGFFWLGDRRRIARSAPCAVEFPEHEWSVGGYISCTGSQVPNGEAQFDCRGSADEPVAPKQMVVDVSGELGPLPKSFLCQLKSGDLISCRQR